MFHCSSWDPGACSLRDETVIFTAFNRFVWHRSVPVTSSSLACRESNGNVHYYSVTVIILYSPFVYVFTCLSVCLLAGLLLAQSCGTIFQMTLPFWWMGKMIISSAYHWQCFSENWKHIYSDSHIRTLLCSLFVVVLTMVVLAVI